MGSSLGLPFISSLSPGNQKLKNKSNITQKEVTQFYDSLVFPSRVSHPEYAQLIPNNVHGMIGDFGCGQSLFYERLKVCNPKPTFLDISLNALKTIDYGLRINADICALPLRDQTYNLIACIGVIHHLPEVKPAFKEISRVLKKQGIAIIGIYSQRSLQAKLRNFYERLHTEWVKRTVFYFVEVFIWLKSYVDNHHMAFFQVNKRAQDLLQTPLVKYLSADQYIRMANEVNLEATDIKQISSMTILKLIKF